MNEELDIATPQQPVEYNDDNIRHLSDMDHVRTRPGMYIGRLGDGSHAEDGIYVLTSMTTSASRCATTGAASRRAR